MTTTRKEFENISRGSESPSSEVANEADQLRPDHEEVADEAPDADKKLVIVDHRRFKFPSGLGQMQFLLQHDKKWHPFFHLQGKLVDEYMKV